MFPNYKATKNVDDPGAWLVHWTLWSQSDVVIVFYLLLVLVL